MVALTPKQEAFATCIGLGMGYTQAYSQAYDVPLDCKAGWLRREAWKMGQRPYIAMTAKQVRSEIVAETVGLEAFTRDEAFQQSQEDHALAHAEKQAGAAVSATKLSAQIAGHKKGESLSLITRVIIRPEDGVWGTEENAG